MSYGIGNRIKNRRIELGLTQEELAKRMGYTSRAAICKVESGSDNITSERVTKFANALGVSESYLMGWDESQEKDRLMEYMLKFQNLNLNEAQIEQTLKYAEFIKNSK